jgi:hypothetical protein
LKIHDNLPEEKDWNEKVVTGVRKQGCCISSWAFAAAGAL